MGIVLKSNDGLIKDYPAETVKWSKALIEPGKAVTSVKAEALTKEEAAAILMKLDQLAVEREHEDIAIMVAEEAESILLAVRMVKVETKENFAGILGVGAGLDVMWLRPKDVGDNTLLNTDNTAGLGLYQGTNAAVYQWLQPFVANTAAQIIPEQKMIEEAALVHLGAITTMEVPKCNAIEFTLSGIAAPAQSLTFTHRRSLGTQQVGFTRFEKPIIVGPEKKQKVRLMPYITGDDRVELLSLLITKAELLTI